MVRAAVRTLRKKIENLPNPRLRIFAYGAMTITLVDAVLGTTMVLAGATVFGGSLLLIALGIGAVIPLLFRGHYFLPRIFVPYISIFMLLVSAVYYGGTYSFLCSIFIGAVYPFAFFSNEEKWGRIITFPAPLIFFAGSRLDFSKIFPWALKDQPRLLIDPMTENITILATYAVVSLIYFAFARTSEKYQTDLSTAIKDLKDALERDKATNASLNSLVQVICHDIATPLQTADLVVKSRKIEPEEKLKRVERALQFASDIIRNVRTLQMARSGKVSLKTRDVLLPEIINSCIFVLSESLELKSIELKVDIDPWLLEHPISVVPEILGQNIITNILSNAIKFSSPNSTISLSAKLTNDRRVAISIADNGIGIPNELIDKVFLADVHTSRPGTLNEKGTGFGLPIAKTCAQLLGARIEVTSRPESEFPNDHGTEFRILLSANG